MNEEFNGVCCDVCGKEYEYEQGAIVSGICALPETWFMVLQGQYRRGGQRLPFKAGIICCSVECLRAWKPKEEEQ